MRYTSAEVIALTLAIAGIGTGLDVHRALQARHDTCPETKTVTKTQTITERNTVTVTTAGACTTATTPTTTTTTSKSTPTPTGCPVPPACDNLGFDWAYYNNSAHNGDKTYSNFHPDTYKRVKPLYVGTTRYVGGLYGEKGGKDPAGRIYGSTKALKLDYFALNHHAYFYACEAGTYSINIPYANDAVFVWTGAKAYKGWTDDNADAKARYNQPDHIAGQASFKVNVAADTYVPIRFVYGQAQYGGGFYFTVTTPSGQVIVSDKAHNSPYVVRHSCDGVKAPKYLPFGKEQ
ncbi:hypothetical protein MHUMG1_08212 [Metarhizium humberi]|uniref:PA14 domain-containing protein n=1 Tax=Metarhizium humberi TaxID=2596975 RepID=A0A9P8M893_9HYPO|nr:hypothetical protein MHUMG1_08212 [Metarhizium humberi]